MGAACDHRRGLWRRRHLRLDRHRPAAGLSINPTTGTISGYPTVTGTAQVTVTLTAPLGSTSTEFSLTVAAPPKPIGCQPATCV